MVITEKDGFERAVEAFVRGFCFTRSFTHPYVAARVGGMWVLRDGPGKKGDARTEEWVAHAIMPGEIHETVQREKRGRFAISMLVRAGEEDGTMREGFRQLGYRLRTTEPFMVHGLRAIPRFESPAEIVRVETAELAEALRKAARVRQIPAEYLKRPEVMRQYVGVVEGKIVGWVKSIAAGNVGGDGKSGDLRSQAAWCASMYVMPRFRQRGIGRALMARMLAEDKAFGANAAVLLASHAGAKLYPVVGYEQIGMLYLYSRVR